jgi:hypothetical protein
MNDGDNTTTHPSLMNHSCRVEEQHATPRDQGTNDDNKSLFGPTHNFFHFLFLFHTFTNYFTNHFSYYSACKPLLVG